MVHFDFVQWGYVVHELRAAGEAGLLLYSIQQPACQHSVGNKSDIHLFHMCCQLHYAAGDCALDKGLGTLAESGGSKIIHEQANQDLFSCP